MAKQTLTLLGVLTLIGCAAPPAPPPPAVSTTVSAIALQLRAESPQIARQLELALRDAQLASARARESAPHLWHDVTRKALLARRDQLARRAELAAQWSGALAEASSALALVEGHVERLSQRRSATALTLARADLATAQRQAAGGRFEDAIALAERSTVASRGLENDHAELMRRFADAELRTTWRRWADETIAQSKRQKAAAIVVDKLANKLYFYRSGRLERTLDTELGPRGLERKLHSGDLATPEGRYRVTHVKQGSSTIYYKALLIDYPNAEDRRRWQAARESGRIPRSVGIGNLIEIHGDGGQGRNWTRGCVAVTNPDIDSIWPWVRVGMPVTIVGTLGGET